jgi:hypothetical protein
MRHSYTTIISEGERWVVKAVVSNTYPWVNHYYQQIGWRPRGALTNMIMRIHVLRYIIDQQVALEFSSLSLLFVS